MFNAEHGLIVAVRTKSGDSGSRSGTKRRESSSADKSSSSKARAPKTAINCMVCEETFACVTFQPCGHTVACVDCCKRMKSCLRCDTRIAQKLGPGQLLTVNPSRYTGN